MSYRYNLNDRIFGGSMAPRLNPKIVCTHIDAGVQGAKHLPFPLVKNTEDRSVKEQFRGRRATENTMLPARFFRGNGGSK